MVTGLQDGKQPTETEWQSQQPASEKMTVTPSWWGQGLAQGWLSWRVKLAGGGQLRRLRLLAGTGAQGSPTAAEAS